MVIDHQVDEEMTLRDEVSDEAMEAAAFVELEPSPEGDFGLFMRLYWPNEKAPQS